MKKQFANGVSESTLTTGTGNITLTQRTGYVRFGDRFSSGDRVRYSVKDGNNREFGYGTYNGGNVLARTTIIGTLDAGTWTAGGSPLNLSGAAIVYTDVEENFLVGLVRLEPVILSASSVVNVSEGFCYYLTGNNCELTLPTTAQAGDIIGVRAAGATNGTLHVNGHKVNNTVGDVSLDVPNFAFTLEYVNASYGWKIAA